MNTKQIDKIIQQSTINDEEKLGVKSIQFKKDYQNHVDSIKYATQLRSLIEDLKTDYKLSELDA